ncbi:helix-turn-helix domain-containing protein [Paenibacillus qinlingensis]|uniref:Sugar-specific transcriptional regulator TrmB n=1 Tax=Paenibacillus qinlingensis TaxID=1837343 RepID=A0ABU1NXD4_9BACL|nr:helix-turn-helix domain-containing protein [Paenibacillus qinlingensis]MDR6552130.1 sugar-specific transcriptional regulator TrmB [Paenibacillus qinlingensis]
MENVLQHLRNLGFTDLEAKCLHVLAVNGTQTGYEIAKGLGVSRSNVYAALQKLAEKGAVLTSHGEPTVYQSVPIEEIGERMEAELQASIRYVKEHLPKQEAHRSEYFSLEGETKVIERIRSELRRAKEEAFCDLSPEEAKLLKDDIREAATQGVRVIVMPTREAGAGFYPFARKRVEGLKGQQGRKFALLIDRKLAIVGTRGVEDPTVAMLTEHPAMVEMLYNHFCSSVVFQELQQDMGTKLEDKYGKNFKKIIQKQIDGKVPEPKKMEEGKLIALKLHSGSETAAELGRLDEGVSSGKIMSDEAREDSPEKLEQGKRKKKK